MTSWLDNSFSSNKEEDTHKAFSSIYDYITFHYQERNLKAIEEMLEETCEHASEIKPVLIVSILRLTWIFRMEIPKWNSARDTIASYFESSGLDSKEMLSGLFE